jgi:hypothetical protein
MVGRPVSRFLPTADGYRFAAGTAFAGTNPELDGARADRIFLPCASLAYSETIVDVSRRHDTQVDATNRERRP